MYTCNGKLTEGFIVSCPNPNCKNIVVHLSVSEALSPNVVHLINNETDPNQYVFKCPFCDRDIIVPDWLNHAIQHIRE